jgi:Zn ribbon nucleic-acid-binding protein
MNMKKTKPKKLLTVLLALCMVLSIVPITAFAVEIDFLPQGVTYLNDFKHTYHTQVNVTANVSVKDSNGAVVETTQVSKSSGEFNFITEGFPSAEVLQTAVGNLQTEIETPYKARGTVTSENESAGPIIDHFESASLYTFTPTSGNPVDFSSDLEAAKQYFNEHSDATGTFTVIRDVHQYQIYDYTYDLTVQENSQPASTITSAVVKNVKFNYQPGDAPQATAEVYNADADKYEIAYECWQEFENNEPVAAWYSDNGSHGSLPTITEFESGKRYVYFLMLKPKDGYFFNSETTVTVNGESVKSSLSGEYLYVPAVKTITPTKQNTVITSAAVENVKLDYKDGEAPRTTATAATADRDKYDILYECWGKLEKTDEYTTKPVAYWYSDEDYCPSGYADLTSFNKDGKYKYSVRLEAKDGYIFSDSISADDITLNGKSLPEGSFVMTLDDNRTCVVTYGMNMRPDQAVEKIDFNARINFIAGDKPSFMTSAVDPFIDLDHERWDANDGSGYGITSSDYWNKRYNGKLITEFEAGKSYTYGVYFKISDLGMEEGYRFDKNTKLYINGEEITLTPDQISVDDNGETIWFSNVLTMTPTTVKVIDVVEINDATVSFKNGDKPVFTGDVPDDVYYVLRAAWWELDSKTGAISADFFSGAYENKITAFEAGKTYHYGVYVVAMGYVESENTTYVFGPNTKLKINGEFVNYTRYEGDESDGSDGTMWVLTDLTMTPVADGHTHKYGTEWKHDETNHWHECECGNKADITAHTFKQIIDKEATATEKGSKHEECTVCGYKKTAVDIPKIDSHNHNYGTEWKHDETNHWHECEDGEKADITAHNFKWIIDKEATTAEKGSKHEECTVCGYKKAAVDIPVTDFGNSSDDQPNKPINTASSESSSADQTNKPINTASPKTGNSGNIILWIALLFVSGGAFITATAVDRKKK